MNEKEIAKYTAKADKERAAWEKRNAMQNEKFRRDLERTVKKVPIPEGYTASWEKDINFSAQQDWVLTSPDGTIKFRFRPGGGGTTEFKVGETWKTFDRRGVCDSFYWTDVTWFKGAAGKKQKMDFTAIFTEELARIAKSREYHTTALRVPDIGFTISPERLATAKRELKHDMAVSFYPSGFGTGYHVVGKQPRYPYGTKRGSAELEKFFEHAPLWVQSFDHD